MGKHEEITPNPNLYPEELQLKLYQAFIFSIPILFSIILFLLFYLFYLKRRANSMASQPLRIQNSAANHSDSFLTTPWNLGIKGLELKDKQLQAVQFDEELKARDILCCVCLGEFEMKEELKQLPLCKHLFHGDCIRHWLRTNATCPLCRCPVISAIKMGRPMGIVHNPVHQGGHESAAQNQQREPGSTEPLGLERNLAHQESYDTPAQAQPNQRREESSSDVHNVARSDEHVIHINEMPSSSSNNSS